MGKASKWSQEKMEGVKSASAKVAEKIKAPVKIVAGSFTTSSGSSAGSVGGQDLEFGGIADARPSRDGGSSTLLTVPFRGPHSRKQSTGSVSSCQNSIANGGGSSSGHGGGPLTPVTPRIMEDAQLTSSPVQDDNLERSGGVLGMVVDAMAKSGPSNPPASAPPTTSPGRLRFKQIGLKVIKEQRKKATLGMGAEGTSLPPTPRRQSTSISLTTDGRSVFSRHDTLEARFSQLRPSRFVAITSALKKLSTSQLLTEHQALVRHLQFSPDGKYLATGSWDRRAIIWKVGEEASCSQHRTLAHSAKGGFIGQVSWSPTGAYLLTKTSKLIKIWSVETGHLIKDIVRHHRIQAVTWLPDGKCFAGVEHDQVHIMDLNGQVLATHRFERMEIHDVAFLPEGERMLLVATLEKSPTDLKPSKSRAEKRIVVYNMSTMKSESQVPVLENVRDVTVSADGQHALVSYEDTAPPEVWRIHMIPGEAGQWARLSLLYTYIPATPVEFAGPSYFGGANDQFIICAGKNGEIHIWDRESGLLLHSLQASQTIGEESGDLTGIAWNHAFSGYFMFASANHDGTVRVWTAPAPPETQPPSRAESPQQMDGRFRALSF
ncbi:hypothetical protein FRC03_004846 [Tulasnella sp. 419]|nr:hypothetical protein FRC03_004846 [Tulasnella sp. 419]